MGKDAADSDEAVGKPGNRESDKCGKGGGEELDFDMRFDVQKSSIRERFWTGWAYDLDSVYFHGPSGRRNKTK